MKLLRLKVLTFAIGFLLLPSSANLSILHSRPKVEHQRLRFKNDFKNPEEVVSYYCGRDASGFVWSGLLDLERKAFTTWTSIPENESFFIAKEYKIKRRKLEENHAIVEVHYDLLGMGDAHGTRLPAPKEKQVTFHLKKVSNRWLIEKPIAQEIAPVVMEEKFPFAQ